MSYVIGVDIGTSNAKAIAFDMEGQVLSEKYIKYAMLTNEPGWCEQIPDEIFEATLNAIKYVVNELNSKRTLLGIGFSSAMHSLIAVNDTGIALTNCIIWADTRSNEYAQKMRNTKAGHEIYMKTGTPIHPMSPLCKLIWIKENMPEVFINAYKFISIKEYIFFKFFNKYLVDYSIASATGMFDIYELKWNDQSLNQIGITDEKLSKTVSPLTTLSGIKSEYSNYIGIDENVPFTIGASDGCLANLGVNAINDGDVVVTIGTSGAIRIKSDKPKNDSRERIFSYILTEDHFILGGAVNNGGVILKWFKNNFSPFEKAESEKSNPKAYELLINRAKLVNPGSDNLIFLPYLLGERAPHWDANSRGLFFGINIKHTRDHFLRAVLEGIIFGIYDVGRALQEITGDINTIYATGGFTKSELWLQILSDVFNKEVKLVESYESSCFGAAILAMKSVGLISSIENISKFLNVTKTILPNPDNHRVYMKNYEIYKRLYLKLKDEFINITREHLNH